MKKACVAMLAVVTTVALAWAVPVFAQRDRDRDVKVVQPRPGAPGEWRLIGRTEANFGRDHDTIVVAGPFDNFRRIKFKVTNAGLNLQRMVVTYDNGAPDTIDVREDIRRGGESRAIDLRGIGTRSLRKIEFWYDTKGILNGKANVTVFGMK